MFRICLADTAHNASQYEHQKGQPAENIFAGRLVPFAKGFLRTHIYLLPYEILSAYPEEHDSGKKCTYRAYINGTDIHPARNNALDTYSHHSSQGSNSTHRFLSGKTKLGLQSLYRCLKQVYQ